MRAVKQDKKHITDVPAFRKKARAFAAKFIDLQRQGFKRLGVQGDWDNPYLTMDKRYEGITVGVFLDLIEKGYDPEYGARPLRRLIEQTVEDRIVEEILNGNISTGDVIKISYKNGDLVFDK